MKKTFILITTILLGLSLTGCYKAEVDNHIHDVVNKLTLPTQVSSNFDLVLAKDNVEMSWVSNNDAIKIANDKAIVTQSDNDVNVKLSLTAKRNDQTLSKDFSVKVLKIELPEFPIYSIEDLSELEDGTKVMLENVTVTDSHSSGTFFTDGEFVIYSYGIKNLTKGDTYELFGTKSSYGEGVNKATQITVTTSNKIDEEANVLEVTDSTIEELVKTTNFSYYRVTGMIDVTTDSMFITDGTNKVEVSSYNDKTSSDLLRLFDGKEVTLNVYITGGKENRTVFTYVTESTIIANDATKAYAASKVIVIPEQTKGNINLPLSGLFNTTITWQSDNEDVISNTGVVNRQDDNTEVTLIATVSLNGTVITVSFDVTVISSQELDSQSLFISEYYEGKSYDKYIEIYNPNDIDINLLGYVVKVGIDGAEFSLDINLTGVLGTNETIVIASTDSRLNESIKTTVTNMGANGMFNELAYRINGNDAIGLFYDDELVDVFGVPGEFVSSKWNLADGGSTVDHRIIRKPQFGANPVWDTTEWTSTAVDASPEHIDDLGKHTFIGGNL